MRIETGDYFVVTRGFQYSPPLFWGAFGGVAVADTKPQYDRSREGMVYEAMEVCDTAIAAKCVFAPGYKQDRVGKTEPINLREVEVMTVTPKYLVALCGVAARKDGE